MSKEFDQWNEIKKKKDACNSRYYHEGEIWWCSLGVNVGNEEDGRGKEYQRPVVVIKGISKNICIVVPLTSSKNRHRMRIQIGIINNIEASAIISQIRIIDSKRLNERICILNSEQYCAIRKAVKNLF